VCAGVCVCVRVCACVCVCACLCIYVSLQHEFYKSVHAHFELY